MKRDAFSACHPAIELIFYLLVLGMTMFTRNPVILCAALISGVLYSVILSGGKGTLKMIGASAPLTVGVILFNGLFNHRGVTVLFFFPWGNAFTLESVIFGLCSALLLEAVLLWLHTFYRIMNMEKMIYLFGRIIPDLGLVISMAGRLIPIYLQTIKETALLAEMTGQGIRSGGVIRRIKNASRILSIALSWAFEHGISTAGTMKKRGYGLIGRTSYEIYHLTRKDLLLLILMIPAGILGVIAYISGLCYWTPFPSIMPLRTDVWSVLLYGLFFAFSLMPVFLQAGEEFAWNRYLNSKTIPSDTI